MLRIPDDGGSDGTWGFGVCRMIAVTQFVILRLRHQNMRFAMPETRCKQVAVRAGWLDGPRLHLCSSCLSGVVQAWFNLVRSTRCQRG